MTPDTPAPTAARWFAALTAAGLPAHVTRTGRALAALSTTSTDAPAGAHVPRIPLHATLCEHTQSTADQVADAVHQLHTRGWIDRPVTDALSVTVLALLPLRLLMPTTADHDDDERRALLVAAAIGAAANALTTTTTRTRTNA
ncbi:hypothetical protein SAMN05660657_04302 [Geodermatophilus amargosae]|uniref:Uncharacterized protein n=1 Tax=Geodermatophilus amargosae TaxID=1296565 RepID=A0A1I7CC13_9ACTN|nr:hypothetical protein [Geodermatophilus amargosae]SFT96954.1 hypothetical protein SAMN05660657_04302 [Geodermatophilus amargosae]